ncbi:MAG: 50S ribosomal protein L22 [Lutisporaceae bacterium]
MEARAHVRYIRMSSRKVNIVIDLIRGKGIGDAFAILRHTPKAASPILEKLLKSATANAENNNNMNVDKLYVAEAYSTQGPTLKRFRAASKGRGVRILKRTCHMTLVVKEKE